MPKVSSSQLPLSAIFAIHKPSGPTSMSIINKIKLLLQGSNLFMSEKDIKQLGRLKGKRLKGANKHLDLKVGQGGTLDPLADGVLVVGVGAATKKLSDFLDCDKEYQAICLLGSETDTYDSEGSIVRRVPWSHVTRDAIEKVLPTFTGKIQQTPPIYSALKMDGKPLYEYAREGRPLPRPIEKREVTMHKLEVLSFENPASAADADDGHSYKPPEKIFTAEQREALKKALEGGIDHSVDKTPPLDDIPDEDQTVPPVFKIRMTCSSGTYVRCIAHDIGHAVGSAAHVVSLTRLHQGKWGAEDCVSYDLFEAASNDAERDEEGWTAWERAVMEKMEIVEK
ncbi:pseudouridylate synthase 4, partial [Sistotremastrum niveocremeum HHB9708]